jgi:peptide chain release factor
MLGVEPGPKRDTAHSLLLELCGSQAEAFAKSWEGTVQWTARSPCRPEHKRKNWFVGVTVIYPAEETVFDAKDLSWEVMRASSPGGQHVNKTESAVRVTHLASRIQASATEERSQYRNRKLALAR